MGDVIQCGMPIVRRSSPYSQDDWCRRRVKARGELCWQHDGRHPRASKPIKQIWSMLRAGEVEADDDG